MCLDAILTRGSQPHQRPSACSCSHLHSCSVRRDTKIRWSGSPAACDNAQRSRKPPIVGIWFKGQPRCNNVKVEHVRTQRAKTLEKHQKIRCWLTRHQQNIENTLFLTS